MMYFVTTFEKLEKHELEWYEFGAKRTVGYFPSLEDARHVVTTNMCDICETIYNYALIEGVEEGLYGRLKHHELYQVENKTVTENGRKVYNNDLVYTQIPLPEDFTRASIAIG